MIIKSHIRGGYRSAAEYMKEQGKNEKTRLVEINDKEAKNLDQAFQNMWLLASKTKATKPLHHISINPMKDERLTDKQVFAIVERCEEKYGYKDHNLQRVIVEHIKDGRQHFHVIWNRVSGMTGKAVWPGEHWKKSKQVCREMEKELGLKPPTSRSNKKFRTTNTRNATTRINIRRTTTKIGGKRGGAARIKPWGIHGTKHFQPIPKLLSPYKPLSAPPAPKWSGPIRPTFKKGGWPEAAIRDWEIWGRRNPGRFFTLWPELSM